ncbi:sulfotransferase 1B1-like [Ostrinia nubilalis]|uniref:sulfotransferase 1B1-like n=1 Tax=Ostrinia nubilalis TaxID=29057 RepID=UPI0030824FD5
MRHGTSSSDFPYVINDVEPEEFAELQKTFNTAFTDGYVRVGPKGYFLKSGYRKEAAKIYNMSLRPDDVWVVTFPKSGTTWVQEMVWMVANDFDYETSKAVLLVNRFPFLERKIIYNDKAQKKFKEMTADKEENIKMYLSSEKSYLAADRPSPRFFKSHLPLSLLPPSLLATSRVVYVARDPRDVAVSYYYHYKLFAFYGYFGNFKQFWESFVKGDVDYCSYFEHLKEVWGQRHHANLLILFYEDLIKDLPGGIRRVARFLGKEPSEAQVRALSEHLKFDNFKKNKSVNFEPLKKMGFEDMNVGKTVSFIRKGKAGGWREHFDEQMAAQAQQWIDDNLRGTDLRFPGHD